MKMVFERLLNPIRIVRTIGLTGVVWLGSRFVILSVSGGSALPIIDPVFWPDVAAAVTAVGCVVHDLTHPVGGTGK